MATAERSLYHEEGRRGPARDLAKVASAGVLLGVDTGGRRSGAWLRGCVVCV